MSLLEPGEGGLNDDTLDELQATDSFVEKPSSDDGSLPEKIVEVAVPDKLPDEAKDAYYAKAVDEMTAYDVQLQTTEAGVTRLHDLDRVADTVLATESIGQSDAEEVARLLPALSEEVAPPSQYTEIPTKTNLIATQSFVSKAVESERNEVLGKFLEIVDAELSTLAPIDTCAIVAQLLEGLEVLRQAATLDLAKVSVSKNFYAYREGNTELLDLRHYGLGNLTTDIPKFSDGPKFLPTVDISRLANDALTNNDFMFFNARGSSSYRCPESDLNRLGECSDRDRRFSWTYMELLTYLASGEAGVKLAEIHLAYEATKTLVSENVEAVKAIVDSPAQLVKVDEVLPLVRRLTTQSIALLRLCVALKAVVTYSREVLDVLRQNAA